MRRELLAKSKFKGVSKTVLEHTSEVVEAVECLFGTVGRPTRLGKRFANLFGVRNFDRFVRNLILAAALHDLGKANEEFQLAIDAANENRRGDRQKIWHEHVSAAILATDFGAPIRESDQYDWCLVLAAVVAHHRRTVWDSTLTSPLELNCNCGEFADLVDLVNRVADLNLDRATIKSPIEEETLRRLFADDVIEILSDLEFDCESDEEIRSLHNAINAGLIIADTVASALVKDEKTIKQWVDSVFCEKRVLNPVAVEKSIIDPRIAELDAMASEQGRPPFTWSKFQEKAGDLGSRALLLSPCGSGKTLAAWKWLAAQADKGIRHAIFLYPTRATATEGFRDYVAWAPESDATLMHGTAAYELESMLQNPPESDGGADKNFLHEKAASLRSIAYWDRSYFAATVDQFLSFLQWNYRSLCMLPVLADAAIVIDEVHSFDSLMFRSLTDLLEHMEVPILCMTATLPDTRRATLVRCGLQVLDAYEEDFPDLREIDQAPRYSVESIEPRDALKLAVTSIESGKKVLWVVNQVSRAQEVYRDLAQKPPTDRFFCYHSRFKLDDRKRIHDQVVAAFKADSAASCFGVTTQVCEMGLDLDADVLITEACPATSLVQRMGRVNRARLPRSGAGRVLVYRPESHEPYDSQEIETCIGLVDRLVESDGVSQASLNELLGETQVQDDDPQSLCSFFRGGFIVEGDYRDISAFTKSAILESDVADAAKKRTGDRKKPIDGLVVPVPRHFAGSPAARPLPRWLSVVPDEAYCSEIGFHGQLDTEPEQNDKSADPNSEGMAWIL